MLEKKFWMTFLMLFYFVHNPFIASIKVVRDIFKIYVGNEENNKTVNCLSGTTLEVFRGKKKGK